MAKEEQAMIAVQVQPSAGQNTLTRYEKGILYLKVAAPPQRGKANQEIVRFLSKVFNIPKGNFIIKKGIAARRKTLVIKGCAQNQFKEKLSKLNLWCQILIVYVSPPQVHYLIDLIYALA